MSLVFLKIKLMNFYLKNDHNYRICHVLKKTTEFSFIPNHKVLDSERRTYAFFRTILVLGNFCPVPLTRTH